MFLKTPTIEELQTLDMPVLMDMLAYQTNLHVQLLRSEGLTHTAKACRESIINIQTAIEMKRNLAKNTTGSGSDISLTQDATPIDPAG
jgi:5-methylcytosine-specific restriction endonuclease McrBC regulatory subunit McrC